LGQDQAAVPRRLQPWLALALAATALAAPAVAASPSRIYFVRFTAGEAHPQLAVSVAGRVRIVRLPVIAVAAPAVARDGRIAFVAGTNVSRRPEFSGASHIWIADADGNHAHALTHGDVRDGAPAWSPRGDRIVFVRASRDGRTSSLWIADTATQRVRRLTRGALDGEPSWSASRGIAFVRIDPATYQSSIRAVDADGTHLRRLLGRRRGLSDPVWSADGAALAVEDGRAIYTAGSDGSRFRLLVRLPSDARGAIEEPHPAFSPDGRRIVFCAWRPGTTGRSDLRVVDVATGREASASRSPGLDTDPAWAS
jgi:TolB protein